MAYYDGETLGSVSAGPLPVDEATCIALRSRRQRRRARAASSTATSSRPTSSSRGEAGQAARLRHRQARRPDAPDPDRHDSAPSGTCRRSRSLGARLTRERTLGCRCRAVRDAQRAVCRSTAATRFPPMSAIVNSTPRSTGGLRPDIAPALEHVIGRALAKEPKDRFPTAKDLVEALTPFDARSTAASGVVVRTTPRWVSRRAALVVGAAVLTVAVPAGWWVARNRKITSTRDAAIPEIRKLISEDRYVEAMAAVNRVLPVLGDDPELTRLWESSSTVRDSQDSGAGCDRQRSRHLPQIGVAGHRTDASDERYVCRSPWRDGRSSRPDTIRPNSSVTSDRFLEAMTVYHRRMRARRGPVTPAFAPLPQEIELTKAGSAPSGMVQVPEGPMSLALAGYDYNKTIPTKAYFIDRNEVTNREYKEFVDAGGYERQEYWKHPFVKDGRTVSWADAIAAFTDQTGRTGPATWEAGTYPQGQAEHPVGGVSWYESCRVRGVSREELAKRSISGPAPRALRWQPTSRR